MKINRFKVISEAKRTDRKEKTRRYKYAKARGAWKALLAQTMRDFPTPAEGLMQATMKKMGFLNQALICGYIADFAHVEKQVIVEIDGSVHEKRREYDHRRDEVLRSHGWIVLHFTNKQICGSGDKVMKEIRRAIGG